VPEHVVEPEGVWTLPHDRLRPLDRVLSEPGILLERLGVPVAAGLRGLLPLRLGGEPLPLPLAVLPGLEPAHLGDRAVVAGREARVPLVRRHEALELAVRDLVPVDVEALHVDRVLRLLLLLLPPEDS